MTPSAVVFITGASSGIGQAAVLEFARQGYRVAGTARRLDRLEAVSHQIAALPAGSGAFLPLAGDVRDAASMAEAVQSTVNHFGRLDIAIANAGIGIRGALIDTDWDDIETLLRTNIDGVLHTIRAAVPAIRQTSNRGQIILSSSVVYNMTGPYMAAYAASKAFVSSVARSLRLELEPDGIAVTDMLIGRTVSEFNDKRLGDGSRASSGGLRAMPAERVALAMVQATRSRRPAITIRWIDRLILLGNATVPDLIGRRAMRQYR